MSGSRRTACLLGLLSVPVLPASAAHACGWWTLTDFERKKEVSFDITYVRTKAKGAPKDAYMKPIAVAEAKLDTLTCSMSKQTIVISGNRIFAGKRQVAGIDGETWEVGGHKYQVTIDDLGEKVRVWRWHVTVNEGGALLASGDAMSFACVSGHSLPTPEEDRLDVARHLMCYLLARDQPGMKVADMPWNRPRKRRSLKR